MPWSAQRSDRGRGARAWGWVIGAWACAAACAAQPIQGLPQDSGEPARAESGPALPDIEATPEPIETPAERLFGAKDTMQAVFGLGGALDGKGSTDLQGFAQLSWFIVDDVELGAELGAWHFDQDGENAAGASIGALIRWHFVNEGRLSLFVDGGLGLLGASDDVPVGGTDLNFLPRAGVGATYRPWDGDLRVIAGVRWHHISNARSSGAEDNPSRDGAMLYLGLCVPF